MVFDTIFLDNSFRMDVTTAKCTSKLDSVPYDGQQADMPAAEPISPCCSNDSSTSSVAMPVTGKFSNIELTYQVDPRVLGTGHHGSVRECLDRFTGGRFAVKSICKRYPAVKSGAITREIMLLREMKCHSIVQLVDVFEDAEYVHLVTDLCKGGELFDKIVEKSSSYDNGNGAACFTEDEAARILHQILNAVSYMHTHNIVHRDLKPENILFETKDEDSPITIIDFGLARKHLGDTETPMTRLVGTPYYVAPEVLQNKYDKSCDLWSVGVIAYILLCGYTPFNGDTNDEVYNSVRKGRYSFPSSEWSGTSREARYFISRLLRSDVRKRMTVEQALSHPWIVKHTMDNHVKMTDDFSQDNSSVDVVFKGLPRRDSIICGAKDKKCIADHDDCFKCY